MKRIIIVLLIVFSVASGALSYSLFRTNSELRSALAAQKRGLSSERIAQVDIPAQKGISQAEEIKEESKVEATQTEAASPQNWQARRANFFKQMLENPERRQMFIDANKGRVERGYAALFKKLNFSDEEAGIFMSLLAERTLFQRGLQMAADDQKAVAQANLDTLDAGLAELLGEEGYASYEEYQGSLSQRRTVDNLNRKLSYSGTPLSDEAAENLISMMASQESDFQFSNDLSSPERGSWGEYSQEDFEIYIEERNQLNSQILESAREILNEDQLDSLLEQQLEETDRIQQWSTIRAQGGFGGGFRRPPG
jgi:hypothetical protein